MSYWEGFFAAEVPPCYYYRCYYSTTTTTTTTTPFSPPPTPQPRPYRFVRIRHINYSPYNKGGDKTSKAEGNTHQKDGSIDIIGKYRAQVCNQEAV